MSIVLQNVFVVFFLIVLFYERNKRQKKNILKTLEEEVVALLRINRHSFSFIIYISALLECSKRHKNGTGGTGEEQTTQETQP